MPKVAVRYSAGRTNFKLTAIGVTIILFYEYFHGDNGAGLGASHQTGWTGCVAKLIELFGMIDPKKLLEGGKTSAYRQDGQKS